MIVKTHFFILKLRIYIFFLLLSISNNAYSQFEIPLRTQNGIDYISAKLLGRQLEFVFDSGASYVLLPHYLGKYFPPSSKLGISKMKIADGSISEVETYELKELVITDIKLKDITVLVASRDDIMPLFGQSAIKKLGSFSKRGNKIYLEGDGNYEYIGEYTSILGCKFGKDDYNTCYYHIKDNYSSPVDPDKYSFAVDNIEIGGIIYNEGCFYFLNDKLISAGFWNLYDNYKSAIDIKKQICNIYKKKYKYEITGSTIGKYEQVTKLGLKQNCLDVQIGIVKSEDGYYVEVFYYPENYVTMEEIREKENEIKNINEI